MRIRANTAPAMSHALQQQLIDFVYTALSNRGHPEGSKLGWFKKKLQEKEGRQLQAYILQTAQECIIKGERNEEKELP